MRDGRRVDLPVERQIVLPRGGERHRRRARLFTRMLNTHGFILFTGARHKVVTQRVGEQRGDHAHGARGILHIDGRPAVVLLDFHRRMRFGGGGTANQQRQRKALALHLFRHVNHLIERRRNQPGQPDDIGVLFARGFEDFIGWHHHAEIDNLVVVALEHHADDIFADVMHVAFYGREHDFAVALADLFARLNIGLQVRDRLLHDARGFHHLRQEHFAFAEEIADDVHAVHQRPFNDLNRTLRLLARLFGILFDKFGDPFHQRIFETLFHVPRAPFGLLSVSRRIAFAAAIFFGQRQQPLGAVSAPVEDHVLDRIAQLGREVVVNRELPGVHDAHVHAVADSVVEEHGVNGFAHRIVAAKRERHVRDAAGDQRVRQLAFNVFTRADKILRIVVVLVDARCDRENVRVEDNIFRREAHLFSENFVRPAANVDFALAGVSLAHFVKRHHHDCRAVAAHQFCVMYERFDALFHRNGVNDAFALNTLQPFFDDVPFRGVDHDGHAGDVRLAGDEIEETHHRRFGVEHPLIHVDIDNLRAALDLLARHVQRLAVFLFFDKALEFSGAGDVGALADVHKQRIVADIERLKTRQAAGDRHGR
ncbi:hypothetical protein BN133_2795 [Cronobacter dublinensis 582]|nr:hypothetical protein BN133_2795 [Cronobacter dublinensis 582]